MKYFLWLKEEQKGPFSLEEIGALFDAESITISTLCIPENSTGEWSSISNYREIIAYLGRQTIAEPTPAGAISPAVLPAQSKIESHQVQKVLFKESSVDESEVAGLLSFIGVLELIASPIAGFVVGSENAALGLMIFISGVTGGLILLGFAKAINFLYESAQRMRRIEVLLLKASDKIEPPKT